MMRLIFFLIGFSLIQSAWSQDSYKRMMNDPSINFYEVCRVAELHFDTIDRFAKGSGYKGYQRWKHANEYKYYPSGKRDQVDPYFVKNAFTAFQNIAIESISFNNGWNELGPFRIDSISGQYSAGLGRVEDHYVDPNDTNTMYIGSRSGGFWKTNDGGITWQGGMTDTLMASGVNTIAVSPTNHDSILINIRNSRNGYSHGIYRSVDGGTTWVLSNFNPTTLGFGGLGSNFRIYKIAYHPTIPNMIFIGTNKGIFRSADNLQTWTVQYPVSDITDIKFHPTNPNMIYLANTYYWGSVRNHILRSVDLGLTYTQSSVIVGNNNSSGRISVSSDCNDCVYFASTNGVWKSVDTGINFTFLNNPPQSCLGFAVNDLDTSNMVYGYVDVMATQDGGNTFNQVTWWSLGSSQHGPGNFQNRYQNSTAYVHADLHPAKCVNGVFYIGTDGTFSKSTDHGNTWQILNQGTPIRENYKLGVSQSNHFRSVSGSQDNGTSIKLRDTWLEFYGADGMEGIIHPLNDDWIISSLQYGGRRRTKDGGQSQSGVTPPNNGDAYWEAPIAYDPNNQMRVYDFRDSIYVSEDFGSTWSYIGKPNSFTGTIKQAAIAENSSNIIVVARNQYIDKSINGGTTFFSIKNNLPNNTIQDIAFDPNNDDVIIVTYATYQNNNNKVYLTTNGGISWTNITYNLGNMPIHSVVIDHTDSTNIYLGAEIGVYSKSMTSNTWSLYNPNLPNTTIEELEIVYGSNTLKAATWGRGLWEFDLMGRNSFPSVVTTEITDQPTDDEPREGVDQFVTSVISYDNTLDSVYVLWSTQTPSFDSLLEMTNTIDSTWVTTNPLPHYPAGTKMYFKVVAIGNSNDTTETYKFMYTVRPFEHCAATGNNGAGNLYINNLSVANINNNSVNDAYTYYHDSVIYLFVDSTYSISLSANTTWSSNDCGAWIDFNHNAIFDASENLGLPSFSGNTSQVNFTVPSNTHITDTLRLRARLSYWGSTSEPCGNTLGEVEDYPVLAISVPTLSYNISTSSTCQGENVYVQYTGDPVDSIVWHFDNGVGIVNTSGVSDSIVFPSSGMYDLSLVGYIHGFPFYLNANNVISVLATSSTNINATTCNASDSGLVVQNLTNTNGCDSIVTTYTALLLSDSLSLSFTSCNPLDTGVVIQNLFNSYGCDSIVVSTTSLLPTDSTFIQLNSCVASDIGVDTLVLNNIHGCDSVILTTTTLDQIQGSILQITNVLTAQPAGLNYQWLNCDSNYAPIVGDSQQVFTALNNGNYAVQIMDGFCIDTTACVQVVGLSIDDFQADSELNIYPNPTHHTITIELDREIELSEFRIFNMIGEDVTGDITISGERTKVMMDFTQVAAGVYIIRTHSTTNKVTKN